MTRPKLLPAVLATATLVQIFILTGCGQGLTGQATGESAGEIEGLKREISSISEGLTELTDQIEQIDYFGADVMPLLADLIQDPPASAA